MDADKSRPMNIASCANRSCTLLVVSVLALTGTHSPAAPAHPHLPASGWTSLIVHMNGPLTPGKRHQIAATGGDVYRNLALIHSAAIRVPRRNQGRLAALPFVRHVSPDTAVQKCDEFTVEDTGADVAFQNQGLTGAPLAVAVVDSGVRSERADLGDPDTGTSRVIAHVNFAPDPDPSDTISQEAVAGSPEDPCGHGTHVAGIIAGNGAGSTGNGYTRTFYGIARKTQVVSVRVLNAQGQGAVSDVIQGLSWIVRNKDQYHIRVVNLSLGHPVGESYTTDPLCQAVEAAWKAGIVVVCAAGNQGRLLDKAGMPIGLYGDNEGYGTAYGSIQSPGNDPDVITVGALKQTAWGDDIATYSSRGPSRLDLVLKPDIVAPGNRIISLRATGSYLDSAYGSADRIRLRAYTTSSSSQPSPDYFRLSGTSMAAPVVAGAAALMLEADPTLSPDTIKARLMRSADKPSTSLLDGPDPCTYGAGALDIPAALASRVTAGQTALSPTLWRDPFGQVHLVQSGETLWGAEGLDLADVWGSQVIWGEDTLSGSQVIWGESVWDDQVIWGESAGGADLSSAAILGE